jgi:hypothetical protein
VFAYIGTPSPSHLLVFYVSVHTASCIVLDTALRALTDPASCITQQRRQREQ